MKILFTGGSSFTGYWFIKELARHGHEVTAIFRRNINCYDGVRRERVTRLIKICRPVFECIFGDEKFLKLIKEQVNWDLFCHHAADVSNYKSQDFNIIMAVANNTKNISTILKALLSRKCTKILLTGSLFEKSEGAGSQGLPFFSPYGLSKTLTTEIFDYYANVYKIQLGKFVIPNPFGPFEEFRFTSYLVDSWFKGKTPSVKTPMYVRDNIHVSLLAKAYNEFAEKLTSEVGYEKINPSGYVESQGMFTKRFAIEMRSRLGLQCHIKLEKQTDWNEPCMRVNTDILKPEHYSWDETHAWDELASYYYDVFATN